jgi:hypothetical protein
MIAVLRARPVQVFAMDPGTAMALVTSFLTLIQLGPVASVVPHTSTELSKPFRALASIPLLMGRVEC